MTNSVPPAVSRVDLGVMNGEPTVRGSVQNLYRITEGDARYFLAEASDAGSVFDVGTFFAIPGSGEARTALRHVVFNSLSDPATWSAMDRADIERCYKNARYVDYLGNHDVLRRLRAGGMRTHHVGVVDPRTGELCADVGATPRSALVLVEEFPVIKPTNFVFLDRAGWDYHEYHVADRKVSALEHVFRLGIPGGSSILDRYQAAMATNDGTNLAQTLSSLGLSSPPKPWQKLDDMLYDCATKFEDHDRHLDWQETIHIGGMARSTLEDAVLTLTYATIQVTKLLERAGFVLWDLKWEIAVDGGEVVVVDTLDQDSVRMTGSTEFDGRRCFIHFNKQAVRDYYRIIHREWHQALNDAKSHARKDPSGRPFITIYNEGVTSGDYPPIPEMDPEFGALQARKYDLTVTSIGGQERFDGIHTEVNRLASEELKYYEGAGFLAEFLTVNSVDEQEKQAS